jgi:hypothetical protein
LIAYNLTRVSKSTDSYEKKATYYFMNLTANTHINQIGPNKENDNQLTDSPESSKLCFSTRVSSGNSRLKAIKLHWNRFNDEKKQVARAKLTEG